MGIIRILSNNPLPTPAFPIKNNINSQFLHCIDSRYYPLHKYDISIFTSNLFLSFFLLGVILKEKYESYIYTFTQRKKAVFVMSICILIYVIAQTSFPGIVFATGFTNGYGLHLSGLIFRLFTQIMCIIMSLSMILIIPNKQFWFTRYGSKTMNVYLLHMLIVFPICWHYCTPFMHTWYGYTTMIILVPLLCCLLFGTWIDKMMRKILFLNNYPSSNK